jgi:AcrR family transcriptional regulator
MVDIEALFSRPATGEEKSPERRIIVAALDCVEEAGLEGATVRAIAAKAGLNPAAVNYYYRSKDRLIEAALRGSWTHVAEDVDRIRAEGPNAKTALVQTIRYLLEGVWRYPRIMRAIIAEEPSLKAETAAFFLSLFARLLAEAGLPADQGLGASLFLSFVIFIAESDNKKIADFDLSKPAGRDRLAVELASRLFGLAR